ncbi:MAG: LOG family protein [Candidatus Melainabacteria bacterium]|nr:LOG family protein [Candidatus Melainabacteria bacterium]
MDGDSSAPTTAESAREESGISNFTSHAWDSFRYSLVQAPVSGIVQLYDHASGSQHLQDVQFFDAPKEAAFGSSGWAGNLVGGTAAAMVQFGVLHRLVGAGAAAKLEQSSAYGLKAALPYVGRSAATGLVFGGVLAPVDESLTGSEFWKARASNAAISAATFSTLTAGSIGLKGTGKAILTNDVVANAAAGLPAGLVDADLRSLANKGRLATWTERTQSMANYTLGGAMAGGVNMAREHIAPTSGIRGVRTLKDMTKLADSTISEGHPRRFQFDERQARLPKAEEMIHSPQSEWYNRATVSLRQNIDNSNLSIAQRKLLVSGTQEMAYGLDAIANRPNSNRPIMTIYGSARIKPGTFDYELVRYIAGKAVHEGYDVQAGGGPGLMEAANRGAFEALKPVFDASGKQTGWNGSSIGVVIKLPFENGGTNGLGNGYQTLSVKARNFYTRAEMLNQAGPGGVFVIGKGGVGTGAEGLNTITQLQTSKMAHAPVFFIGKETWKPMHNMFKSMAKSGMISKEDLNLYQIIDDPKVIFAPRDSQSSQIPTKNADRPVGKLPAVAH